ncbi:acetyl-CoA carboxylase biotin carboxyl carrier protein [Bordetella genomosp. 12]|uniref:Biotin carboxyl carrier protein of acetyl-CoA carboxylase n=1 Tax=Bordetella genomosp. 12 TaxID=463035 RepID=A0A261VBB1_9BORD|nr:biotin/lipoyl-containing protein [Bordetella genomosp. 12]OZI70870.1 hypothetical protein CAL22_13285 [Bordetella genomosp. 12]
MHLQYVQELAALMARLSITELDYVSPEGARISLTRAISSSGALSAAEAPREAASEVALPGAPRVAVPAGMGGIFHRRPAPGEAVFVNPGDIVQEGQTLGLMEAMKMLLPVEAPVSGVLGAILVEDGQPVQPSTCLMEIIPQEGN